MQILFKELKNYKISLLFILVFTYISTISELTIPLLLANAINIGIIQNYGLNYIKRIVILMLSCMLTSIILNIIINYLINKISILSSCNIRNDIFSKTLTLKTTEKSKFLNSSLITRTTQDVENIKGFISSLISIIFKAPIIFFSCITILKTLNKNFSLILIISIIILIIYLTFIIIKLFPLSNKIQLSYDKLTKLTKEKIEGIEIIKSYNNLDNQDNKFKEANNSHLKTTQKIIKLSSLILPTLNLIINSLTIIILLTSINLVKKNSFDIGSIMATIQYILQILLSIIMISMIILQLPKTKTSINRIKEIMNSSSYNEKENNINLDINEINYNNVSFSYTNNKNLEDITFKINKGEKIGIIGPTGCGKSTLIKLLLKENELTNGSIHIDNYNINDLTRKNIISNITYIPQNCSLLKGTILENIAFGNPYLTMPELQKIIYTTNLTNFINSKKENIHYKLEESSSNISGGQKQRICLARALARNTNMLILDDTFSALDYKNEKEILNNLNTLYKDKTIITISQRISSIKNCNKIIVMDNGKIIAIDNHDNLLKNCTLYKEMHHYQKEVLEYDI